VRLITILIVITWISALIANRADAESVLLKREGGVLILPVQVNNAITLNFMIDSGASDVVIPLDVFSTLSRAGTITSQGYAGFADVRTRRWIPAEGPQISHPIVEDGEPRTS